MIPWKKRQELPAETLRRKEKALQERRAWMVEQQLQRRGIGDSRVLTAFGRVPRERFIAASEADFAYEDAPLPIDAGQTISQPYIVALTVEALELKGSERVLEIGTGSGYETAVLSLLADEVFTVERIKALATQAKTVLDELGYHNVNVRHGDGSLGWPEAAPFEAIAVSAGGPVIPDSLLSQLTVGGRLVMPVGRDSLSQKLVRVTRETAERYREEALVDVRFVPLIGAEAWPEDDPRGSGKTPPKAAAR